MSGRAMTALQGLLRLTGARTRHTPLRRLPQVQIELARTLPAWLVRGAAALLLLLAGMLVATGPAQLIVAAAVAVGIMVSRTGDIATLGIALVVLAYLARQEPQSWLGISPPVQTAGLLVCLHACAYLARRCAELSARARIEVSALAAGAGPALAIAVFAQLLNLLSTRLAAAQATAVGVVALAALATVCWRIGNALRASRD